MRLEDKEEYLPSDIFKTAGMENDFILKQEMDPFESYIYRTGKRGRYYFIDLQLHLDSIGPQQTKVKMITHDGTIISGYEPGLAHMALINPIEQKVKPSTIEEHQILREIGDALGILSNMPAVQYPK